MKIDLYSSAGAKTGSLELPSSLFEAPINKGLMHLALVRQQSNRRVPIAHVKHRGEMSGSTKKVYQQKHTGNARRGPIRSPLMKGGGKSFGPRNEANFTKDMPKKMRRAALLSCLSLRAKEGAILGLENYGDDIKTKTFATLLKKLPIEQGRRMVVVTAGRHRGLELSARNVARVKTISAEYLNPEDLLVSKYIVFLKDAVTRAEEIFGKVAPRAARKVGMIGAKATKETKETKEIPSKKITKKSVPKAKKA